VDAFGCVYFMFVGVCIIVLCMWVRYIAKMKQINIIMNLLVVKVPSAGSPRVLPDIGDTTTV